MSLKKDIYIISGLGADERVFQKMDFSDFSPHFLDWIPPRRKERIAEYALRMAGCIDSPNPIIIGLSFGGMMAIEIAKQIHIEKLILISSAKSNHEIPFYYRWIGKSGLHKFIPVTLLKKSNFLSEWLFGTQTEFDKKLLATILHETDSVFLKWAIDQVATWRNQTLLPNVIHIHGSKDKILPIHFITYDYLIRDGGHLMTLDKYEEISLILKKLL